MNQLRETEFKKRLSETTKGASPPWLMAKASQKPQTTPPPPLNRTLLSHVTFAFWWPFFAFPTLGIWLQFPNSNTQFFPLEVRNNHKCHLGINSIPKLQGHYKIGKWVGLFLAVLAVRIALR